MSAFEAYKEFLALRKHFTSDYDYHKFKGSLKLRREHFEKRRDYYFFEKLGKKPDFKDYIVANIIKKPNIWVQELVTSPECEKTYTEWKKYKESLSYTFKEEIANLPHFTEAFWPFRTGYPPAFQAHLKGNISLETLCLLLKHTGVKSFWDKKMLESDPVWSDKSILIDKYIPFIQYDTEKIKGLIMSKFNKGEQI